MQDDYSLPSRIDADSAVGLADERGKFVVFNRAAERLLGIAEMEFETPDWKWRPVSPIWEAAPCRPLESLLSRAMCGQSVPDTELFLSSRDSFHGFWVNATAGPLLNDAGDVCGGIVVFHQVAKKKSAETSPPRLPAVGRPPARRVPPLTPSRADVGRDSEMCMQRQGSTSGKTFGSFKEERMSEAALQLNFSSPIDYQVRHVVRLVRSGDLDMGGPDNSARENRALSSQSDAQLPRDADCPIADERPLACDASVSGRPRGFSKNDEDHIRQLLDSAAEAICEIDLAGHCTFANPACAKLLGYADVSKLLGKHLHSLTHPRHADGTPYPEQECPIHHNYCRAEGVYVEEIFWRADGSCFYAECRSIPILQGGRVVGAAVTFLDITDRKQLEEQLRQSQRMEAVGRLVGGIAHDFNNFLTAINIYNELLTDSLGSNLPALQLLREVKDAVERSASLTRQLLAFGGKQPLAPQTFCLNDVVREAEPMLRRMIGNDVQLETTLELQLAPIKADPEQLERVIVNLVVNARHATPAGGTITIQTTNVTIGPANEDEPGSVPAGRYVALSVTDTGAGMSAEIKRRVFDPYFTTKGPEKGTGLGLAVAQGIVKQLKGCIEVDSEPGRGARFTIYLPSTEPPAPHESAATSPPQLRRAETILFVDRDKSLRKATCELLQQFGFEPLEASSSEEAMLMSSDRRQPISMIVTGSSFSREESQALTEQLLALRPKLKSLCLAEGAERPQFRGDGAHELPPPHGRSLTPVSLSEKIRRALEGE